MIDLQFLSLVAKQKPMKRIAAFIICLFLVTSYSAKSQVYDAQNVTLLSNWFDPAVQPEPGYGIKYNGLWGYTDSSGHEYAIIGATHGVYYIDVTNPASPVEVDFVPGARTQCIWREIKTYSHYCYMISDDSPPNSFQIADLQYLPDSVHIVYDSNTLFERAHTLFIDSNLLYCGLVKGGQFPVQASMAVFSLANPEQPVLLRKLNDDFNLLSNNQVHDMFVRNDTIYASCAYDGLYIFTYDRVNNQFVYQNSITTYPSNGYNHSSALTDDGHTLVFTDEVPAGLAVKVLDVTDIQNLTIQTTFESNPGATPHNPFMVGNMCYIAYYQDGLQIYDVSNPTTPVRTGYFDTYWQNPAGTYPNPAYAGAWGAYPYLPSGNILVSDMQNGLYVLDASAIQGTAEIKNPDALNLYPNPVQSGSMIHAGNKVANGAFIRIHDITGRIVKESLMKDDQVDTRNLKPGLYNVIVTTADHKEMRSRVIIY